MFRHMTVAKNIAYGLRVRPRRERRVRSTAASETFSIL
jgi:ABC-type sulfate/molybdate transport systems ATPase subunit